MDDYHIITSDDTAQSSDILADLRSRARHHTQSTVSFVKKTEKGLFVGLIGKIGDVLGAEHEFAREAPDGRYSGVGRKIAFNHAFHCGASDAIQIPDLVELSERQCADLLYVLTEAHAGREPVSMEPVKFSSARSVGTDWDRIAAEVEAGKCRGGFFTPEGKLLERFENIAKTVTKEAQKKTVEKMARLSAPVQAEAMVKELVFMQIAPVTIGVAMTGWAAWKLIEHDRKRRQSSREQSRS